MSTRLHTRAPRPPKPFVFARSGRALTDEIAVEKFLSWLTWSPDTDETLRRAGITRDALRALEADDEVSQCLDTRREAVIATPWRLEPGGTRAAKWLTEIIAPHMETIVRGAFGAVPYGYSVMEAVYRRDGGRLVIDRITEKPFEWFEPKHDGRLIYRPSEGGEIEADTRVKFFATVRNPTYLTPYGEPLLSRLYWPVFFRSQGWRFWLQFVERFGTPLLLGETQGNPAEMAQALYAAVQDAAIAVGPGSKVTAIEAGKDGQQFAMLESAIVKRVQKLILGQTLTSDVDGKGSYAAAKVHDSVRQDKRNADIRLIGATVQRIVDALAELNGLQTVKFCMEDETRRSPELTASDVAMVNAGMVRFTADYLQDVYGLDPSHFEIPDAPAADSAVPALPAGSPAQPQGQDMSITLAPRDPFTARQMVVERGIDATLDALASPVDAQDIQRAIRAARDPADLEERLGLLLRDSDPREFRQVFERALFAADVIGYAHARGVAA